MSPNENNLLVIWILVFCVNLAAITVAVILAIRSRQFADMDFPSCLPLGPKTLKFHSRKKELHKCTG
jgi:hypothetical protein